MSVISRSVGSLRIGELVTQNIPGLLPSTESLPGQSGSATLYVTPLGTRAWARNVFVNTVDDLHMILLVTPELLSRGVATPFVVYNHQATGDETVIFAGNNQPAAATGATKLLDSWLDLGYGVASLRGGSTSGGGNDQWGNEPSRTAASTILTYLEAQFSIHAHGFLLGGASMGAASAVNIAAQAKIDGHKIAAIATIDGSYSTRDMYERTNAHSSAAIATAIGLAFNVTGDTAGDADWVSKVDGDTTGHDPIQMNLGSALAAGIFWYLEYSPGDGVVDATLNSEPFITALGVAGYAHVTGSSHAGSHIATGHFIPTEVNPVFAAALA